MIKFCAAMNQKEKQLPKSRLRRIVRLTSDNGSKLASKGSVFGVVCKSQRYADLILRTPDGYESGFESTRSRSMRDI